MVYRAYIYNSHDGGGSFVYDTGRIDTSAPSGQQCLNPDPQQFGSIQDLIQYAAAHNENIKQFQSVAEVNAYCSAAFTAPPQIAGTGGCVNCPAPGTSSTYGPGTAPNTISGSPGQTTAGVGFPIPGQTFSGASTGDPVPVNTPDSFFGKFIAFFKTPLGWLLLAVIVVWALTRKKG
jgi:hypothetical protein